MAVGAWAPEGFVVCRLHRVAGRLRPMARSPESLRRHVRPAAVAHDPSMSDRPVRIQSQMTSDTKPPLASMGGAGTWRCIGTPAPALRLSRFCSVSSVSAPPECGKRQELVRDHGYRLIHVGLQARSH
jgi:hypothetical protein